jgi:Animal haem peroxidase
MSARHGVPIRGLLSTKTSPLFEGRFGRMFRCLPPARFGATDTQNEDHLTALGQAMSAEFDEPKDGKDDEESGIPALYTYLGQFIDHDITFDPASSLQKQNDPDALTDFRTPALDLDSVYGRGPDDQPYLYDGSNSFLLGDAIAGGNSGARDLPRNGATPRRALIGDPRNDENTIVSQLQGLFLRFHNRFVVDNPTLPFSSVQQAVRFHYQYVVANDFLPRIVHSSVISALKHDHHYDKRALQVFHWRNAPFLPVEFSVAAYRQGHSMVRPGYRLSDTILLPIFPVPPDFPEGLTGFRAMNPAWGIDWSRFIDLDIRAYDGAPDVQKQRLQFAYRIDTSIVNPLSMLPPSVASNPASLPQRNLLRGWRLGLPSGQDVARAMGVKPLKDQQILLGQGVDHPDSPLKDITAVSKVFAGNCPLWTYILAEAMRYREAVAAPVIEPVTINTPKLGPVGGRIVAEVILGLMFGDPHSFLSMAPQWTPKSGAGYTLKDFVGYALGR